MLGRISSSTLGVISTLSPTMPCNSTVHGPTFSGVSMRREVVGELSLKALAGEIDPIALDAGEDNFERGALLDRLDAEDRLWRSDRRDDWLGGEGEGDAEDVGVFDREELGLRVQLIGLPPQRAADDLLAEKLRPERADAHDVGYGVRVPALRQHRDRDDAADALAEAAGACRPCS